MSRAIRPKRGTTLIEVLVGMGVFALLVMLLFTQVRQSTLSEKGTNKEAEYAFQRALLAESLSDDIHSSSKVEELSPGKYKITRWVDKGADATQVEVSYEVDKKKKQVVRQVVGQKPRVFDFSEVLTEKIDLQLKLDKVENTH